MLIIQLQRLKSILKRSAVNNEQPRLNRAVGFFLSLVPPVCLFACVGSHCSTLIVIYYASPTGGAAAVCENGGNCIPFDNPFCVWAV